MGKSCRLLLSGSMQSSPLAPVAGPPRLLTVAIAGVLFGTCGSTGCACAHVGGTEKVPSCSLEIDFSLKMIDHSLPAISPPPPFLPCPPQPSTSRFHGSALIAAAFLGLEDFRTDLHLHSLEGVVGSMPAIPADAIHVFPVLPLAVVDPIEVGVCAAVVPVATFTELCTLV